MALLGGGSIFAGVTDFVRLSRCKYSGCSGAVGYGLRSLWFCGVYVRLGAGGVQSILSFGVMVASTFAFTKKRAIGLRGIPARSHIAIA